MHEPYTPATNISNPVTPRAVWRYLTFALILLLFAISTFVPAVSLMNQNYGWSPSRSVIYDTEINGQSVSIGEAIRYVSYTASFFLAAAAFCALIALRNWRANRTARQSVSSDSA
ncbi:MAG: hypothetical protein AAF664_08400 [Planctomycetota bacterium]